MEQFEFVTILKNLHVLTYDSPLLDPGYEEFLQSHIQPLRSEHGPHMRIINLSERNNTLTKLNTNVQEHGWPDHMAPMLKTLLGIIKSIDSWLQADSRNVVLIHCKGGRGRVTVVLRSFLFFMGNMQASNNVDMNQIRDIMGRKFSLLLLPSQQRYLQYFQHIIEGGPMKDHRSSLLHHITLHGLSVAEDFKVVMRIYHGYNLLSTVDCRQSQKLKETWEATFSPPLTLSGDTMLKCLYGDSRRPGFELLCRCQIHSEFITTDRLYLKYSDLDDVVAGSFMYSIVLHFQNTDVSSFDLSSVLGTASESVLGCSNQPSEPNSSGVVTHIDGDASASLFVNGSATSHSTPSQSNLKHTGVSGNVQVIPNPPKFNDLNHYPGPVDGSMYASFSADSSKQKLIPPEPAIAARNPPPDHMIGDLDSLLAQLHVLSTSCDSGVRGQTDLGLQRQTSLPANVQNSKEITRPHIPNRGCSKEAVHKFQSARLLSFQGTHPPNVAVSTPMHPPMGPPHAEHHVRPRPSTDEVFLDNSVETPPANGYSSLHALSTLQTPSSSGSLDGCSNPEEPSAEALVEELYSEVRRSSNSAPYPSESKTTKQLPSSQAVVSSPPVGVPSVQRNNSAYNTPGGSSFPVRGHIDSSTLPSPKLSKLGRRSNADTDPIYSSIEDVCTSDKSTKSEAVLQLLRSLEDTGSSKVQSWKSSQSHQSSSGSLNSADSGTGDINTPRSFNDSFPFDRSCIKTISRRMRRSQSQNNESVPDLQRPAGTMIAKDTISHWYKPSISRDEAISLVKDRPPGTFVVRDSQTFKGAFGLVVKVETPPLAIIQQASRTGSIDLGNELVRHFLIETVPQGVQLKGCPNEPVFLSLSALIYQHTITSMALPVRLIIPTEDPCSPRLGSVCGANMSRSPENSTSSVGNFLRQDVDDNIAILAKGRVFHFLHLGMVSVGWLSASDGIQKGVDLVLSKTVHSATLSVLRVESSSVTLKETSRRSLPLRPFPMEKITFCSFDPSSRTWDLKDLRGGDSTFVRVFGFICRKEFEQTYECVVLAETEREQQATDFISLVNLAMQSASSS